MQRVCVWNGLRTMPGRKRGMVDVGGRRDSERVDVYGASRTPGTLFDLRRTLIGPRGDLLSFSQ